MVGNHEFIRKCLYQNTNNLPWFAGQAVAIAMNFGVMEIYPLSIEETWHTVQQNPSTQPSIATSHFPLGRQAKGRSICRKCLFTQHAQRWRQHTSLRWSKANSGIKWAYMLMSAFFLVTKIEILPWDPKKAEAARLWDWASLGNLVPSTRIGGIPNCL